MQKFISRQLVIVLLLLVSLPSVADNHNLLNIVCPYFPPYSYSDQNKVVGIGPDLIKRVLNDSNIAYKITLVADYATAVQALKVELADGLLLASKSAARDELAVFTQPMMTNNWSWFLLKNTDFDVKSHTFKSQAIIGSIKGTNTYQWLQDNGYKVLALPQNARALVAMLKSKRIDAAFVADVVFEYPLTTEDLSLFKKVKELEKPFGMYISRHYLRKHPTLLEQINRSIEKFRH
ncbi:substrate-binding periplasmic protein [Colwellia chukchiensis]|uniref:substrate-binding periplasmic protein n=1 Tax=Colwellia chukchiensis TaxID=641665 RepID=UPI00130207EA|nr:transporter substrate-binding domain-containing protein [Colwellia chukchiensis]